jgi:UDP-N-acetyl-D-glucosamine dehydrogenase
MASEPLTPEALAAADCVVIVTNHRAFDYDLVLDHATLVVDTRRALRDVPAAGPVVVRL